MEWVRLDLPWPPSYRLQLPLQAGDQYGLRQFADEVGRTRDYLHFHSFMYDFEARRVQARRRGRAHRRADGEREAGAARRARA